MNRYLSLSRILLISSVTPMAGGRHEKIKSALLMVLLAAALAPMIAALAMLVGRLYAPLTAVGQQGILLGLGCALSSLLIFIFGIFYTINVYYFAQDVEFLLPLPLKPAEILGAKFTVTLIFEYLMQLLLLVPLLVTFGIKSGAGLNYYLIAALVFFSLPVIPLVLASLLAMVLMSYSSISRHKDRFRIWAGGLGLIAALGLQFLMQRTMVESKPEDFIRILQQGENSLTGWAVRLFPGVKTAVQALLQQGAAAGWLNLLLFLLLTGLFLLLLHLAGKALYFRGAVGGSESFAAHRALSASEMAGTGRRSGQFRSLVSKEFRLLVRTPAFFMNCVLINFIWPVMLLFTMGSGQQEDIEGLRKLVGGGVPLSTLLLAGVGAAMLVAGTSGASASGISREGGQFFAAKYLPAPYMTQIKAKMAVAFMLAWTGFALLLGVVAVLFHLPPAHIALLLLASLPAIALPVLAGMLLDIQFPKLIWDNEYRAVKQNMNIVLLMVFSGLAGGGCIWLAIKYAELGWTPVAAAGALVLLADAGLYILLSKKAPAWLAGISA